MIYNGKNPTFLLKNPQSSSSPPLLSSPYSLGAATTLHLASFQISNLFLKEILFKPQGKRKSIYTILLCVFCFLFLDEA